VEALVGGRTGEGIGSESSQRLGDVLGPGGDQEPVQIVRVLIDEASWCCLPLTEFVEFGDQQRGWAGDVGGIGTNAAKLEAWPGIPVHCSTTP
jgi:hypothetical protein